VKKHEFKIKKIPDTDHHQGRARGSFLFHDTGPVLKSLIFPFYPYGMYEVFFCSFLQAMNYLPAGRQVSLFSFSPSGTLFLSFYHFIILSLSSSSSLPLNAFELRASG
jgi:hypothetical protein